MEATLYGPFGQVTLGSNLLTIGREQGNYLVLPDPQVAAYHAEIRPTEQGYTIADLDAPYGTFVNGQRIYPRVPCTLNSGDMIQIGNTILNYIVTGSAVGPDQIDQDATTVPAVNMQQYASRGTDPYTGYGEQAALHVPPPPPDMNVIEARRVASPDRTQLEPAPSPRPARRRLWLIVGVLGVVVVLMAAGVVAWQLSLASTPTKTLNAFCSDIQGKNYQGAYALISIDYQAKYPEPDFKSYFSSVTSCAHSNITTANSDTVSMITLAPDTTYPWTYQVALLKDSSGNWKIDSFSAAPDLMLDTFCSDVQNKNYQDAYNLTSLNYQRNVSESTFQNALTSAASCQHNQTTVSGATIYTNLAFGPSSSYPWSYQAVLIKDGSGNWRIDNFNSMPDITLANFCSDLGSKDYADAYALTSAAFQSRLTEAQFAGDVSGVVSCTSTNASASNGTVTSTISYVLNNNSTFHQKAFLVKDSNGDWKIDSFQNI